MKTIKKKILMPYIIIIVMIPVMIMVLFNVAMNIYVDHTAKKELRNSASSIGVLVQRQLIDSALDRDQSDNGGDSVEPADVLNSSDSTDKTLTTLKDGLKRSKLSLLSSIKEMNIEFLIVSSGGKVLFPKDFEDSYLNDKVVNKAKLVLQDAEENTIRKFHVGKDRYFSVAKSLTESPNSAKLIFISYRSPADSMIKLVNLILLGITLLAIGISTVIALIVSKSISLPIIRLTSHAKRIGSSEFLTLEEDHSSVEIYELTKSMNEMSQRIKNYDDAQKSFLQNASHELRTPLMSIQGYAEGIARGVFPDTVKTAGIICEESQRLNRLVEELLTLSRIENNNYMGNLIDLNLSDFMKDYVQRINGYAIKEGKSIVLTILSETVTIQADEVLLSQAVLNIISNCIKFAKKEVTVTVYTENNQAKIRISDDGNGIAPEDLPHIFDRFYKGKQGNFGLGLSIAKSSTEFMSGGIVVYNESGAVFIIQLPLL